MLKQRVTETKSQNKKETKKDRKKERKKERNNFFLPNFFFLLFFLPFFAPLFIFSFFLNVFFPYSTFNSFFFFFLTLIPPAVVPKGCTLFKLIYTDTKTNDKNLQKYVIVAIHIRFPAKQPCLSNKFIFICVLDKN